MQVSRTGKDTVKAHILRLIETGQEIKPRIQALANQVSGYFIFAVLVLALASAWYWYGMGSKDWISITIAVLVVSCPCALSLATPLAIASASSALMKKGVVLANAGSLEALEKVEHFVFDKTGTLVPPASMIVGIQCYSNCSKQECLEIAGLMQQYSAHPLASAFPTVNENEKDVEKITHHPSRGLSARIEANNYFLGSRDHLLENTGLDEAELKGLIQEKDQDRYIYLARDRELLCVFTLQDTGIASSAVLIDFLKMKNKKISILSGDTELPTRKVALALGIDTAKWGLSPGDKLHYLEKLQASGQAVAMVGDGMNDAPVLATAGVSIAMGHGAAMASCHSDIILLRDNVSAIREIYEIAVLTRRVIRQNMLWALSYNLAALPLAMTGQITPWMAAIGMSVSSLLVLLNSSRIGRRGGL